MVRDTFQSYALIKDGKRSGMGGRSKWVEEQNGGHERRRTSDEDVGDAVLVDDLVSVRCWGIQAFQNGKNRP